VIDINELVKFTELERSPEIRKLRRIHTIFAGASVEVEGHSVKVKHAAEYHYDYVLSAYGVLTWLGGSQFDKTPLCYRLDAGLLKLFERLIPAETEFLRGSRFNREEPNAKP
jgi:hypothetical protein